MSREAFTITLETLPDRPGDAPPARRMAQLLKLALRGFRFRCIDVRPGNIESGNAGDLRGASSGRRDDRSEGESSSVEDGGRAGHVSKVLPAFKGRPGVR
jgi:hypothetical protein